MKTHVELEAEMEPNLRQLAKELDRLDAVEAAAEAELRAELKAAPAEAKAKVKAKIDAMRAKNAQAREALNQRIETLIDQMNDGLHQVEAQIASTADKTNSDLEARRSALHAKRAEALTHLRASLSAQLKHIETQLNELQGKAASAKAQAHSDITALLADMRIDLAEARRVIQRLDAEDSATVHRAMSDLQEGLKKAAAEFN